MKLTIICAWCKKIIGTKEVDKLPVILGKTVDISHGICPDCCLENEYPVKNRLKRL